MILSATKKAILASSFLSISTYEVTIMENQPWILIHYYVVAKWKRILILLTLE
jgi:hypothetical protein